MRMNDRQSMGCEMCKRQEVQFRHCEQPFPEIYSVAMSYVPIQVDTTVYDDMKALCEGTLFVVLDKPFMRGCKS